MPRRLPLLVATLLLACSVSSCAASPGGLSEQQLATALPAAAEIGPGWASVGTTTQPPADDVWDDALTAAAVHEPRCHEALLALDEAGRAPTPSRFARSIYRKPAAGAAADQDLTLTIETFETVPDRWSAIRAMRQACAEPLRTKAGVRTVTMTVKPHDDPGAGTVGYTVQYRTSGLTYSFDYVLARRDQALVSASTTGPSTSANQSLLRQVAGVAAANLDRVQGQAPSPGGTR